MSDTVIHTVKARETGTTIEIIQLGTPTKQGDKWAAKCQHGSKTTTKTRRDAHAEGRHPKTWCATCKKGANGTKPAAAKTVAKKAPAKRAGK